MDTDVELPQWLDEYIFRNIGAKYCRKFTDMTVIDWDHNDILAYLGTYSPRSYAESYCIFKEFIKKHPHKWNDTEQLDTFDFGCGTGGEIIGMATAVNEFKPNVQTIRVKALDGNRYALHMLEKIAAECSSHYNLNLLVNVIPCKVDDFYDLSVLEKTLDGKFDIFMSVKAICEFVTKDCFEKKNAYEHIVKFMLPKLKEDGIILLEDVTSYNDTSKEWLPKLMDKGLESLSRNILMRNEGFNQVFTISHSMQKRDTSKVAWRLIQKGI